MPLSKFKMKIKFLNTDNHCNSCQSQRLKIYKFQPSKTSNLITTSLQFWILRLAISTTLYLITAQLLS